MGVFFVAGCGLFAALGSEQLPFLILGLFGGHLFQVLVTGEIMWTGNRVLSRANGDRGYWIGIGFLCLMLALPLLAGILWPTAA